MPSSSRRVGPITLTLLLGAAVWTLPGCGYTVAGGDDSDELWRTGIATVAVPTFDTSTFRRYDEVRLTQALGQAIEARTPYRLAPEGRADTVLTGEIVAADLATLVRDRNNATPQEQLYVVAVDFMWKDLRTGEVLVSRRNFEASSPYYPYFGESEEAGSYAAAEDLAGAIVDQLVADW